MFTYLGVPVVKRVCGYQPEEGRVSAAPTPALLPGCVDGSRPPYLLLVKTCWGLRAVHTG